uniref:Uncharacterized protein n=1 Tax=Zosterops lateralis melanops TaxID=1220523 RepID=A0A8D2P5L7_ZOSLA
MAAINKGNITVQFSLMLCIRGYNVSFFLPRQGVRNTCLSLTPQRSTVPTWSGGCPTGYCNMELNSTCCIIPLGIKFILQSILQRHRL